MLLVEAEPAPIRRVQCLPDEPPDQEVVRNDQLVTDGICTSRPQVLLPRPGELLDGRPGERRTLITFCDRIATY